MGEEASETWGDTATLAQRLHWHMHQALHHHVACSVVVLRPLEPLAPSPAPGRGARSSAQRQPDLTALAERIFQIVRRDDGIEMHPQQGIGVVLRGAESDGARAVFLRLRDTLTRSHVPLDADEVALTLAFGYATHPAGGARDMQDATASIELTLEALLAAAWEPRVLVTVTVPLTAPGRPCAHPPRLTSRGARSTRGRDKAKAATPNAAPETAASAGSRRHLRLLAAAAPTSATEMAALRLRAQALGVPYATVPARVPSGCRRALDVALARKLQAVPIGRTRGLLTVAMHNPSDAEALSQLEAASGLTIFPVLGAPRDLARALRQWSGPK